MKKRRELKQIFNENFGSGQTDNLLNVSPVNLELRKDLDLTATSMFTIAAQADYVQNLAKREVKVRKDLDRAMKMSNGTQTDMQGAENAVSDTSTTATTSILLGDPTLNGTNLLSNSSVIVPNFDMAAFLTAFQSMQTNKEKSVYLRDLPTFGGQPHKSAEELMLKYSAVRWYKAGTITTN